MDAVPEMKVDEVGIEQKLGIEQKVRRLARACVALYREQREKWKALGKDSMHNEHHVLAGWRAGARLVEKATNFGPDPLGIRKDLQEWNLKRVADERVPESELPLVFEVASMMHDLGYGYEIRVNEKGQKEMVYRGKLGQVGYDSGEHEDRSAEIAAWLMEKYIPADNVKRWLPLVKHLTHNTKYELNEAQRKEPFALLMQMSDQVGQAVFNQTDFQKGLLDEMLAENPNQPIVPFNFFNFPQRRFLQLCEAYKIEKPETLRSVLSSLWGRQIPFREDESYSKDKMSVKDYVESQGELPISLGIPVPAAIKVELQEKQKVGLV